MKAQMKKEEPKHAPVKAEAPAKHIETVKPITPAKHVDRDWMANPFPAMWNWFEDMEKLMPDLGVMNRLAPRFYAPDLFRPAMRMFREMPLWNDLADFAAQWTPPAEVMRRDNDLIVRVDLPGIAKDDIKVDVEDHCLKIHGERKDETEDKREGYYRSERTYGSFYRHIPLPDDAKADKAEATFANGVLEIRIEMPKAKKNAKRLEIVEAK
jgi:HSP20 family protein